MKSILILAMAFFTQFAQAQFMGTTYQVDSLQLDRQIFSFSNALVNFSIETEKISLRIYNNICPQIPGRINCKAMPMLAFSGEFQVWKSVADSCNIVTHYTRRIQSHDDISYLVVKDYRGMNCDMVYTSDFEITLNLKRDQVKSVSKIYASELQ